MKDAKLLIVKYEELRDICIELHDIADRHPELKEIHIKLIEIADVLIAKSHELYTEAFELDKEEKDNEDIHRERN